MATDDPLWSAIRAAHQKWSPETAERFPPPPQWEPPELDVGTGKVEKFQETIAPVPAVPTVPTVPREVRRAVRLEGISEKHAAWEERAAILEYDGGLSRAEAELRAADELGYWEGVQE